MSSLPPGESRKDAVNSGSPERPPVDARLTFSRYDERFLAKSWEWLNDAEIKRLTMTPDFTREDQLRWFARLPSMTNYLIWGVSSDGVPIGATGLKHITGARAEYWGYIGDRKYWGTGLGREMLKFGLEKAKELHLAEVYLRVHNNHARAIRLYTNAGFETINDTAGVLKMRKLI
jgi:RimJ/RimL family protein N-acetyltransferase